MDLAQQKGHTEVVEYLNSLRKYIITIMGIQLKSKNY